MVQSLTLIFILVLWPATLFACDITGTVRAEGKQGVELPANGGGKYESRKFKFVERVDYTQLRDFVVYLDQPAAEKPTPPAKPLEVVTQKDAIFKPHVLPVVIGTTVAWPNQDEILHNVYSFSETKQFDLGLYKNEVKKVTFDKPGRVDVFCSIHSKMHCVILVLENDTVHLDRKSTRLNSSHGYISYAVFCLKKKKQVAIGCKDDIRYTITLS